MRLRHAPSLAPFLLVFVMLAGLAVERRASAEVIIKSPNPPRYSVEIEPKLNLAYLLFREYGGTGWGPGVRVSIPLMSPGFIKSINDSVAISFGLDVIRYSGNGYYAWYGACTFRPKDCPGWYAGYNAGFWTVQLPVAMQWNFWITDRFSAFAEPGLTLRHALYSEPAWCAPPYYDPRFGACNRDSTSVYFTFYAGARIHLTEKLAITMRLGHPVPFSVGLSIFL